MTDGAVRRPAASTAGWASDRWRLAVLGLAGATVALVLAGGWRLGVDSPGYLNGKVFRTPVYPLLLDAARALFGAEGGLTAVFVLQTVVGCAAAAALALALRRRLELPGWLTALVALLLLEPFFGRLAIGNRILTEPLAYGIFLLVVGRLLAFLDRRRPAVGLAALALTAVAILHRPQFVFLVPVEALVLWAVWRGRAERRRLLAGAAALAAMLAAVWLSDHAYRWLRHGSFTAVPFTGTQLGVAALHLARPQDAELFEGRTRELFVELQGAVAEAGLAAPESRSQRGAWSLYRSYAGAYNPLLWKTVLPVLCERTFGRGCVSAEQYVAAERILLDLSRPLLARHAVDWARLLAANLASSPGAWYLLAAVGVLLAGRRRLGGPARRTLALAAALAAANLALVALVEPVLARYSFYTDTLSVAAIAAALVDLADAGGATSR